MDVFFLLKEPDSCSGCSELLFSVAFHILGRKALTIPRYSLLLIPAAIRLTFAYNFAGLNKRDSTLMVADPTTAAGLVERGESLSQPQ